jgi:DNA-binding MarR family transcriptional regulator
MTCEPSNATFVLDRLEEQGLVERRPHPTDRRAKQIMLTAAGERTRASVLEHLDAQSPLDALTPAQQESLRDLLRALAPG